VASGVTQTTWTSMLVSAFGVVFAVALYVFGTQDAEDAPGPKERSMLLDHAKLLGSFLVIYGHFMYYNLTGEFSEMKTWLNGAQDIMWPAVHARGMVMMPLICFVSGVCSQGSVSATRLRRFLMNLVFPTMLWVFVAKPVIYDSMMTMSTDTLYQRVNALWTLKAFHEEWYLQALVLWRGSTFMLWSNFHPAVAFILMLAASCLGGYHHFDQSEIAWMKLDETLGFLPYFAVGYVTPFKKVEQLLPKPSFFPALLILGWTIFAAPALFPTALPDGHGWYGCCGAEESFPLVTGAEYSLFWTRRLAKVSCDVMPMLALVFLVLPRSATSVSWIGSETLHPYLFHILVLTWVNRGLELLPIPKVTSEMGHVAVLLLHVPLVLLIQFTLASKIFRWVWKWCFEPAWLLDLVLEPEQKTTRLPAALPPLAAPVPVQSGVDRGSVLNLGAIRSGEYESEALPAGKRTPDTVASGASDSNPRLVFAHRKQASESSFASTMRMSTGRSRGSCRWTPSLPITGMKEARVYYPLLLPLFLVCTTLPLLTLAWIGPATLVQIMASIPPYLVLGPMAVAVLVTPGLLAYHAHRLGGTVEAPPAEHREGEPLTHVVVVVEYKEPVDVLERTMESIAAQSDIDSRPIVVVATEGRDPERHAAAAAMQTVAGDRIQRFIMTEHKLSEGETVGKHSNENAAMRQIYRQLVEEEGMDPFEILITIVDADSILSQTYLSWAEASYKRQQDGRRLIYSGPINTYRNFSDGNILVQMMEVMRNNADVFYDPRQAYHPQSNYTLSLGLCSEIGFWSVDSIPEDIHTAAKAMLNNFGSLTTVPIPPLISNDLVAGFSDRYVQAKRHQWAITEIAWYVALAEHQPLTFPGWAAVAGAEMSRAGSFFNASKVLSGYIATGWMSWYIVSNWATLPANAQMYFIAGLVAWLCSWGMFWICEAWVWRNLMPQFPIKKPSVLNWIILVGLSPIWQLLATLVFFVLPTLHVLVHAAFWGELSYVCAPKGDQQAEEVKKQRAQQ